MQSQLLQNISECDCVVVGGGIIGLSIAWRLLKRGKSVVVVDRQEVGQEASWASGGMIRPLTENANESTFFEFCLDSAKMYDSFIEELELETGFRVEYNQSGSLLVAFNEHEMQTLRTKHQLAHAYGVSTELLSTQELREKEEKVSGHVMGGLFSPRDLQLNNRVLVACLVAAIERCGGHIVEHCSVENMLVEQDTVVGVVTQQGPLKCSHVVCCAGAWSSDFIGVDVRPVRGQMVRFDVSSFPEMFHIINHDEIYLIPREDRTLIVGSTMEDVGFDRGTTDEAISLLKERALSILPELIDCEVVEMWSGFRPCSPDGYPIIGTVREGLIAATGHFRNGILLAPITGDIVEKEICDGVRHELFSPRRFASR